MPQQQSRTARIEARITPEMLAVVRRAAEIEGRSLSDFVVAAAQDAARRTIEDNGILTLSLEDQRRIAEAILDPPPPNEAMKRAIAAHDRLVVSSR